MVMGIFFFNDETPKASPTPSSRDLKRVRLGALLTLVSGAAGRMSEVLSPLRKERVG